MQAELGDGPQGQRLLVYRADYRRYGENLSISVAQDYTPVLDSFARVRLSGLGLVGFALLALLLLQRYAMGLALRPLLTPMIGAELYLGMLYLCALPATVQSAIAFTSLARGNIPAAVCSAAASSLIGIFLTPLLVLLLMGAQGEGGSTLDAIGKIVVQMLLPFIAGQIARRWIGDWVARNKGWLKNVDQSSILLLVYTAFSHAVVEGIWQQVPLPQLLGLVLACCLLLALALLSTWLIARWLGFDLEDRITILFCGSKKSLATGVPMAQVLFASSSIGMLILPLMLFHQIQLMVCAVLAQRYAKREDASRIAVVR